MIQNYDFFLSAVTTTINITISICFTTTCTLELVQCTNVFLNAPSC